ncbi:hypothetical protein, partial [Escherichia coli]|uniref:hypothetical protein n=1 Tax=Escherichia coli TaxID=562 RepID=UPI003D3657ED
MESYVGGASDLQQQMVKRNWPIISRLARIEQVDLDQANLGIGNTLQVIVDGVIFSLQLEGVIDLDAERARLT